MSEVEFQMVKLKEKYSKLLRQADKRLIALHEEQKTAKKLANANEGGWKELADYEEAKTAYLMQKQIAQIYGQIDHDLESKS